MSLSLVTEPTLEPISLTEAKLHCKVDHTADDALFPTYIQAAREYGEGATFRAFCRQTFDFKLDEFPYDGGALVLPKAPVRSITSITYLDTAGASQTWSSSLYLTDLPSGPKAQRARITPAYGESYPSTRDVINAVTVRFVAGYAGATVTVSSITRTGSTATATTSSAHGYTTGQRVTIAGADQADYNGTFEVTVTGATTFTFSVSNSPTTPATGALTAQNLGIPGLLIAAMLLLIGRMNEKRQDVVRSGESKDVSTADSIFWQFKAW